MPCSFTSLPLSGLLLIESGVFADHRGFFMETYKESEFKKNGIDYKFAQDNHSYSIKGVLRGLHFQHAPNEQAKLVRVAVGSVWDVAIDIRSGSPTRGKWYGVELNAENHRMLFIPPGFAHGFLTLSDTAHFLYKCSYEYDKASERGIRWDDPDIGVRWPMRDVVISEKDAALPYLKDAGL